MKKYLLHVGCGYSSILNLPRYFNDGGWEEIRLDIDPSVEPDIIGTLQDMSLIESGTMDGLYSSHNIEHVWSYEVPQVIGEFSRVLKPDGFAIVLCPDIISVAHAVVDGYLNKTLYESAAGPISAMDILYGLGTDLAKGRHYMAHKTAFTSESLAEVLINYGFGSAKIVRDKMFGLHAIASKQEVTSQDLDKISVHLFPSDDLVQEVIYASTIDSLG